MATPIRHIPCGTIIGWYVGDKGTMAARSADVVYLDGSRPKCASKTPACPHCGYNIPTHEMVRCFDEDIDPVTVAQDMNNQAMMQLLGVSMNPVFEIDPDKVCYEFGLHKLQAQPTIFDRMRKYSAIAWRRLQFLTIK